MATQRIDVKQLIKFVLLALALGILAGALASGRLGVRRWWLLRRGASALGDFKPLAPGASGSITAENKTVFDAAQGELHCAPVATKAFGQGGTLT